MGNATNPETLQFNWFGWTAADWNAVASMATVVGVAVALFGGLLALRTYRNADRTAKDAHMHTLLRDFMRTQFDFELGLMSLGEDRDTAESRQRLGREATSLKLYVLEQMWFWLSKQTRRRDKWRIAREISSGIQRRIASKDAWAATILSHVMSDRKAVLDNLKGETDCYNLGFLKFLADDLGKEEPDFRRIYEDQETLVERSPYRLRHPDSAPWQEVTLRLPEPVVEHFRAGGAGWQTRIGEVLERHVVEKGGEQNRASAGECTPGTIQ